MDNVTVYSQPGCMPCMATARKLDTLGVSYTYVDVTVDDVAAAHLKAEGWQGTPVVEVTRAGEVVAAWQGLRLDALTALGTPGVDIGAYDKRGA